MNQTSSNLTILSKAAAALNAVVNESLKGEPTYLILRLEQISTLKEKGFSLKKSAGNSWLLNDSIHILESLSYSDLITKSEKTNRNDTLTGVESTVSSAPSCGSPKASYSLVPPLALEAV